MTDPAEPGATPPEAPRRTLPVPCPTCGEPVDLLRADEVAAFEDGVRVFCSARCRARRSTAPRAPAPRRQLPAADGATAPLAEATSGRVRALSALAEVGDGAAPADAPRDEGTALGESSLPDAGPGPTDVPSALRAVVVVAGVLAWALVLLGDSPLALTARVALVALAAAAAVGEATATPVDRGRLHPAAAATPAVAGALLALGAFFADHPATSELVGVLGLLAASLALLSGAVERARRPVELARALLAQSLEHPARRVSGGETVETAAAELRAGEEILIEPGESLPVDVTLTAGTVTVQPWQGAPRATTRTEGQPLVAGARVLEGRARASVGWTGPDRAMLRLTWDPRRRADLHSAPAALGAALATRGAVIGSAAAALVAFSADRPGPVVALEAILALSVFANRATAELAGLHVARAVLGAQARGIVFRTADALDVAGRVSVAVFCARGTLLLDEPSVAVVEGLGGTSPEQVLSLVAGAQGSPPTPAAAAVRRAARARDLRPDAVRSPSEHPGLGITAIASNGQALVVGSRGLMLRERVSIATVEPRVVELEALGRAVLLVALGGRLVGLVALQDGLRAGARAAVQHLLDARIEPVLLSSDARETCEALGRAVDIEHVRPEVLPADRGDEIRRLADGGATVAVVGRSPGDDVALGAADLPMALAAAGSSTTEWGVHLAGDDARDAAVALRLAAALRRRARAALLYALGAPAFAAVLLALGLAPRMALPMVLLGSGWVAAWDLLRDE